MVLQRTRKGEVHKAMINTCGLVASTRASMLVGPEKGTTYAYVLFGSLSWDALARQVRDSESWTPGARTLED